MSRYLRIPDAISSLRVDEKNLGRETLSLAHFSRYSEVALLPLLHSNSYGRVEDRQIPLRQEIALTSAGPHQFVQKGRSLNQLRYEADEKV